MSSNRIHPLREDVEDKTKGGDTIHVIEANLEEGVHAEVTHEDKGKLRVFQFNLCHLYDPNMIDIVVSSHSYSYVHTYFRW